MTRIPAIDVRTSSAQKRERFKSFFGNRERVFLPVIHTGDEEQAMRSVEVSRQAGADGVFLVNHGIGHQKLLRIARTVVARHPDLFVGVKCLDLRPQDVFCRLPQGVRGVWVDNAGSSETATAIRAARQESGWEGLYFGGVALDYESPTTVLEAITAAASRNVDVVTAGGPTTGQPPSSEQLKKVRAALGPQPLALASKITMESTEAFLPHVECFLPTACILGGSADDGAERGRITMVARQIHAYRQRAHLASECAYASLSTRRAGKARRP